MAVYDRWHKAPADGDKPCRCGRGRLRLYPGADHLKGDRWQVRWDDPNAATRKQKGRNFALRDPGPGELPDPDRHASAFDKEIQGSIIRRDYSDPNAGTVKLRDYSEGWRKSRVHGESAAAGLESRLRNHVYEDPARPGAGRTPKGGVSIGQHTMQLLAGRPSLTAAWAASIPLADRSRGLVMSDVSAVFRAAVKDRIVRDNPVEPMAAGPAAEAQPYAAAEVAGIAAKMPARFAIVPYLGAGTGMREMEMAALGADDIVRGKAPKIRVLRQLKQIDGELRYAPIKNRRPHDVPVPPELLGRLDAHMEAYPPLLVTLPWHEPGSKLHGTLVPVRLVLSKDGAAATRNVMDAAWRTAVGRWLPKRSVGRSRPQQAAVGRPLPKRSVGRRRPRSAAKGYGIHRTRHTFASAQLRAGVDIVRVAAWMGDTVAVVQKTYAHLMPDDHDGEAAGRAASAAFLGACARSVPAENADSSPAQLRAV